MDLSIIQCCCFQDCFPGHAQYIQGYLLDLVGERVRHCKIKMDCCLGRLHNYFSSSSVRLYFDNLGLGNHRSSALPGWSLSRLAGQCSLPGRSCLFSRNTWAHVSSLGAGRGSSGEGRPCCLALSLTWTCAPAGVCVPSPALVW